MEYLTVLIPGSIDLAPTSRRTDKDGLTAALISAAMAGADPVGINMLKTAITGDRTAQRALYSQFYAVVNDLCVKGGWRFRQKDKKALRLTRMAEMAVLDIVVRIPCPQCKGERYELDSNNRPDVSKPCQKCHGIGARRVQEQDYAKTLEIDESTWRGTWQARYNDLLRELQEREYDARRYIKRKLLNDLT